MDEKMSLQQVRDWAAKTPASNGWQAKERDEAVAAIDAAMHNSAREDGGMKYPHRYQLGRFGNEYFHWSDNAQAIIDGACLTYRRPWWWLRLLGWKVTDTQEVTK